MPCFTALRETRFLPPRDSWPGGFLPVLPPRLALRRGDGAALLCCHKSYLHIPKLGELVTVGPSLHFSQVMQESRIVVASDRDHGDFMNLENLVVKMPRADC